MFFYDEERNSVCAREMAERNDLIVPTFNYELRSDKPPLHYYFMMLSYKVFGVNEFAARFFSVLSGACVILITFLFTRKYLDIKSALYAILILITSLNLSLEFHLAVPDPYLILLMTVASFLFYDFYKNRSLFSLALMYIALGLAVLTKGPVALGLVGFSGILFLILKRDFTWKLLKAYRLHWGAILILIIVLPWFIEVGLATNWQWQKNFLLEHNLIRFTEITEGHGGFFGLTFLYVLMALLPFSIFIFQSFWYFWKKRKENDFILFSGIFSLVPILFFTISVTKLPNYPMPAYPFLAVITGFYLSGMKFGQLKYPVLIYVLFSFVFPIALYSAIRSFSELSFLHTLPLISLIIPIGALLSLIIWRKGTNLAKVLLSLSIPWMVVSILTFTKILPLISHEDPVQHAMLLMTEDKPIAYYRRCNSGFPWYLRKPIRKLITIKELTDFVENTPKFYLISALEYEEELKGLPLKKLFQRNDLFESPVTVVYEQLDP